MISTKLTLQWNDDMGKTGHIYAKGNTIWWQYVLSDGKLKETIFRDRSLDIQGEVNYETFFFFIETPLLGC